MDKIFTNSTNNSYGNCKLQIKFQEKISQSKSHNYIKCTGKIYINEKVGLYKFHSSNIILQKMFSRLT